MAINQNISGIKVDTSTDNGKVPVYNSATSVFDMSTVSGSPGGSNTQLQYNNAGSFGGISGATTNGTVVTLTSPVIATSQTNSYATASTIAIFDGSKNLISADTATYPSLTELSYVKGVTSSIQTQLNAKGTGSVTSVAQSFTGGLISVSGSPITTSGTLALTVAGTSGGIPYFSSASTWATSAALAANALVIGGGAGAAPSTTTTGTGVLTALGVNVGSAGAFVTFNGALGTPSSGTVTNLTGTASININGTVGATTPTTATFTTATINTSLALAENASIALDPAGSADGKYTGITITGTAGYTQSFGDLVYLDPTDSRWEAADANSAAGADGDARGMLAMVVSPGTDGTACTLLLQGVIRADAKFPAFTVNNPIYVSETAGSVTQTQPTTTDVVIRIVGAALTADEMYFNPDWTWITHT